MKDSPAIGYITSDIEHICFEIANDREKHLLQIFTLWKGE